MFAGGRLTEMTKYFLEKIDLPSLVTSSDENDPNTNQKSAGSGTSKRLRVLDLCCGSGSVGAAVLVAYADALRRGDSGCGVAVPTATSTSESSTPKNYRSLLLHSADADTLAVKACRKNLRRLVGKFELSEEASTCVELDFFLSDGLRGVSCKESSPSTTRTKRYDLILSNPPVHNGVQTDFSVVAHVVLEGRRWLRKGGRLLLVLQEYIPLRSIVSNFQHDLDSSYSVTNVVCDGKYAVWDLLRI
ncbi:unnamed protein product [Amoebophrya sp. A25]|nr:unnamed protein product [Amoebophrya sp. A25]|eukprot:GSA25T00002659001.1